MNELRSFLQWRVKSSRQPGSLRTLSQFSLNKARIHKKVCSETRGQSTGSVSSLRKTLWPVLDHASLLNAVWSSSTYMSTHSHCGGLTQLQDTNKSLDVIIKQGWYDLRVPRATEEEENEPTHLCRQSRNCPFNAVTVTPTLVIMWYFSGAKISNATFRNTFSVCRLYFNEPFGPLTIISE